ncbi:MAG: M48 family metalloprotease [Rickettsiaceae bacterium]|nr:M48 family metalloprotease [Rickettsiaceae bacterium]
MRKFQNNIKLILIYFLILLSAPLSSIANDNTNLNFTQLYTSQKLRVDGSKECNVHNSTLATSDNTNLNFSEVYTEIIDAEINNSIEKIARPILNASGVKNVRIHILVDKQPNAFTTYGGDIYISSGLIATFSDPNVIRGVIAHELGHIKSGHLLQLQNKIMNNNGILASTILLGAAAAAITGSTDILYNQIGVGMHTYERSILKFSRENELVADASASRILQKAGYDDSGLLHILNYLDSRQNFSDVSRYDRTHPICPERINMLKSLSSVKSSRSDERSLQKDSASRDEDTSFAYKMSSAKLGAFGEGAARESLDQDYLKYASICMSQKKHDIQAATRQIDELIKKYPKYPFFLQKKAELLLSAGSKDAIIYYERAASLTNSQIIKIELAIAKIILLSEKSEIDSSISMLEMNKERFGNNKLLLNYLSLAYDKKGDNATSLYYRALSEYYYGKKANAKKIANAAKMQANNNKSLNAKIKDIINEDI